MWRLGTQEAPAGNVVSPAPQSALHIASCGLIVWTVRCTYPWHFLCQPGSPSLLYLSRLYFWKCDSTPGIILQQFNILLDISVFRRGKLMHFPVPHFLYDPSRGGGKVGLYSDLEFKSSITLTNYIHLPDGYSQSYFQFYIIHNLWFGALLKTLCSCSQWPILSLMAYHEETLLNLSCIRPLLTL